MKALGLIGMILGVLAMSLGLYLIFVVADHAAAAQLSDDLYSSVNNGEFYYGTADQMINRQAMELKTDFGVIVMAAGLIAFLASILPAIRAARLHPVEALRYE